MARHRRRLTTVVAMLACAAFVLLAWVLVVPAALAALTTAPLVRMERVDVSGHVSRAAVRDVRLPINADMIGASWLGATELELRVRAANGRWSRWVELDATGDGPDPGSTEALAMRGRNFLAAPVWVGGTTQVQLRATVDSPRALRDVRLQGINVTGTATRFERERSALRATAARTLRMLAPRVAQAAPRAPRINQRAAWKARTPANTPSLAPRALGVVVHHTVSANNYACSQVPALLRGIQRYHMDSNGWNDIGYNFLVDRCGNVWEGRAGGLTAPVIGAHAAGFNTGTVGVAMLGTHSSSRPTPATRAALRRLISWRMDVAHVAPTGKMSLTAQTGDKFPLGSTAVVRATSGHRDLFPTSCPGAIAYRDLNAIARAAWVDGGLKVANITATPTLSDPARGLLRSVRVRAIANTPTATLTVRLERISDGSTLHTALVRGAGITTEHALVGQVPVWDVRVVVNAALADGQRARGSSSLLGDWGPDPGFTLVDPPPPTLVHGAEAAGTPLTLSYTLTTPAVLSARLIDPATGERVASLFAQEVDTTPTGPAPLDLRIPASVPAGTYELRVGVQADTAPGRSEERFVLTLTTPA